MHDKRRVHDKWRMRLCMTYGVCMTSGVFLHDIRRMRTTCGVWMTHTGWQVQEMMGNPMIEKLQKQMMNDPQTMREVQVSTKP